MKMRKRLYAVVAVLVLLAGGAGAAVTLNGGASAGCSGCLDDGKELLPQARITLDDAIARAQTAASGDIGEVDLEYYEGKLVFNVDVGDQDVKIDATTGEVLGATRDD